MAECSFPSLAQTGRPPEILETLESTSGGIILISEYEDAGIPFTLTAMGHEMKHRQRNVIYLGFSGQEPLPGIDSILVPEMDSATFDYLTGDGRPDFAIVENVKSPALAYLSYVLAQKGTCVIVGIFATSTENALENYVNIMPDASSQGYSRYLVTLGVHHSYDIYSQPPIQGNRFLMREAEKKSLKYFNDMGMKRTQGQTVSYGFLGYQVTKKFF